MGGFAGGWGGMGVGGVEAEAALRLHHASLKKRGEGAQPRGGTEPAEGGSGGGGAESAQWE